MKMLESDLIQYADAYQKYFLCKRLELDLIQYAEA